MRTVESKKHAVFKEEAGENNDKFSMDFVQYQRTKTKSQIEKDYYDRRVRKDVRLIEKVQSFVAKSAKLKNQYHSEKLEKYFANIRSEFNRIEKH